MLLRKIRAGAFRQGVRGMSQSGVTRLDLSIVVINHNHRGVIEKCFDSLFTLPDHASFEVALIDNACADGTAEWVRESYPEVVVHCNSERRGFAANANTGMRALGRGRYVMLLNPDVISIAGVL